ncbi:MAG TPA: hypothetical protein VG897_17880 [Terriglobales bacterium]|nr:hypothetical protein [Terriglobales bacterium]
MRASLQSVIRVLKTPSVPDVITQKPFDHDPGHYRRLCSIQAGNPDPCDLVNYALDMQYMDLQPDLLRNLTPLRLTAWRRDLFEGDNAGYGAFVEHFWPALLKGVALKQVFTEPEQAALADFLRDSILDRLDVENSLHFSGMGASPYRWVQSLVAYGVLFSDILRLWNEWWDTKTIGHAIALFQFASALMCDDKKNPVFAPWTRDHGGGPPALWDCGCHMFDIGWKEANLSFLRQTVNVDYVKECLRLALHRIPSGSSKNTASRIVLDLPKQEALLALRIQELPKLLENVSAVEGFTV